MSSLVVPPPLASAAAVFCGPRGAVSRLAHQRGTSRQRLYREAKAVAGAIDPRRQAARCAAQGRQRDRLRAELARCRAELTRLRQQLRGASVLGPDKLAEFAATAQATGVSLSAAHALLAVALGRATPSLASLGRLAHRAGQAARATLAVLDGFARRRAKQVAADEIFVGRKPVLMTVEQHSLCWLSGRPAADRGGREWAQEFAQLPELEQLTRDGGVGMEKGLILDNARRRQAGLREVADQEDHFHILHRGRRGLRAVRAKAARALKRAEQAQAKLKRDRRKRKLPQGRYTAVANYWRQAEAAFDRWAAQERCFERLRAALRLVSPEGQLNTPQRAWAEVEAALAGLTGPEWSRLRRGLIGPKALTFLKRVHEQLAALPVCAELRQAAVRIEGLRCQPEALRGESARAGALRGVLLACGLVLSVSKEAGTQALALVRGVLAGAWRSSSLVESLNSVLRMQQRRQKRLTQGLLDLKRLYWNGHVFRAGRRQKQSPYERLGLKLPPGNWWQLLQKTPEQLQEQLSALNPAA